MGSGQVAGVVLVTWRPLLPIVSALRREKSQFPYNPLKKNGVLQSNQKQRQVLMGGGAILKGNCPTPMLSLLWVGP